MELEEDVIPLSNYLTFLLILLIAALSLSIQTECGPPGNPFQEGHPDMPRDMLIQVRAGTAAEWAAADPVLAENEPGYVTDTHSLRFGDGTTPFSELTGMSGGISVSEAITTRQVPYVPVIPDIVNPDFEAETLTGWTEFAIGTFADGSAELSTAQFHAGSQSLHLLSDAGSSIVYGVYQNLDLRDTTSIKFWVYGVSGCVIRASALADPEEFYDLESLGSPTYGEWKQVTYAIPSELRVKEGIIRIGITPGGGGNYEIYLDDVSYILDGASDECNFIPDIDQYIKDEVDIRLGLPVKTTAKQILYRPVTGESEDYDWIPDLDAYIDTEIDSHLEVPDKSSTKQVLYRPDLINILANPGMEDGPLIPQSHTFNFASTLATINPDHIFDGGVSTINENHKFSTTAERDAYFTAHPGELEEGLLIQCSEVYGYQRYLSSVWATQYDPALSNYERDAYFTAHPGELEEGLMIRSGYFYIYTDSDWEEQDSYELYGEMAEAYYTAHPEELIEGALRIVNEDYEQYIESTWEIIWDPSEIVGGWLIATYYGNNILQYSDTSEKHSGSKSLAMEYIVNGYGGWCGAGICQHGLDFTDATFVRVWVKAADDAIGKEITVQSPFESDPQTVTDSWAQYVFPVPEYAKGTGKTLEIMVGEEYATPDDNYTVYWDDAEVIAGSVENFEWIEDIDTYFNGQYVQNVESTDNAVPRFNGTDGEVQDSLVTIDDSGSINIPSGQSYKVNGTALAASDVGAVTANDAITGATKCKITYDAKGLVTSGSDLAESDLPTSTMRFRGSAASDPADSRAGDCYLNTGDSKLYMHNGTSYIALT